MWLKASTIWSCMQSFVPFLIHSKLKNKFLYCCCYFVWGENVCWNWKKCKIGCVWKWIRMATERKKKTIMKLRCSTLKVKEIKPKVSVAKYVGWLRTEIACMFSVFYINQRCEWWTNRKIKTLTHAQGNTQIHNMVHTYIMGDFSKRTIANCASLLHTLLFLHVPMVRKRAANWNL